MMKEPGFFNFVGNWRSYVQGRARVDELAAQRDALESDRVGKRKKTDRDIKAAQGQSRRAFLRLVGSGLVVAAGGTGAVAGVLKLLEKDVRIKTITPIKPFDGRQEGNPKGDFIANNLAFQQYWRGVTISALERFRSADPLVGTLIDFVNNNGVYSIPVGPTITQIVQLTDLPHAQHLLNNPHLLEIVYMPEKYALKMPAAILTESGGHTIRVATKFKSQEWLGIMFAHEVSHAYDQIILGEDSRERQQYLAGEVKAHLFEMKLLKSWSPETYEKLIRDGIPLYRQFLATGNPFPLRVLILSLYPLDPSQVSFFEDSLGVASCLTAIAFEEALQRGLHQDQLGPVYTDLVNAMNAHNAKLGVAQ